MPNSPSRRQNLEPSHPPAAVLNLQERKQQLVRDTIWEAAIDLISRQGFTETTVDEIAQAAGTSRRTFFRYFESKSDLMAQAMVSYGANLKETIENCPASWTPAEVFRQVVLKVARQSVSYSRTRKIMEIAAKYPAAKEAQVARIAEVQDQVAEAFARRSRGDAQGELTAQVLAGLTLSMLRVIYGSWFEHGQQDVAVTAGQVFATLGDVVCGAAPGARVKASPAGKSSTVRGSKRKAH